jgi:hypothetical protein
MAEPYPATVQLGDLPAGTTVAGTEIFLATQTTSGVGRSVQLTVAQLASALFSGTLLPNPITFGTVNAAVLNATTLNATTANVGTLNATTGNFTTANIITANITTLNATTANIRTLNATTGNFVTLNATTGNVVTLNATTINVATLNVTTIVAPTILTIDRTYYVSTVGSDSNTGLSAGQPFQTIAHAISVANTIDVDNFSVLIQLADGTYNEHLVINSTPSLYILGNPATPANVVINCLTDDTILALSGAVVSFYDLELRNGAGGTTLGVYSGSQAFLYNVRFASGTVGTHMLAASSGRIIFIGNCAIVGSATNYAMYAVSMGTIGDNFSSPVITLTGTPAFSIFAFCEAFGFIDLESATFAGTGATGIRYVGRQNSVFYVSSNSTTYFPGNAAGDIDPSSVYRPLTNSVFVMTLANGANNDVPIVGGQSYARIAGPTAAFSISGFVYPTGGAEGLTLVVQNPTAQTMTITNQAGSAAGSQILTETGADVVLAGPCVATFFYSVPDTAWTLQAATRPAAASAGVPNQLLQARANATASMTWQYPGWVLLNTFTVSNVATVADTTSFTATFDDYVVTVDNLLPVVNSTGLMLRYISQATTAATSYINSVGGVTTYGDLTPTALHNGTGCGWSGAVGLHGVNATNTFKMSSVLNAAWFSNATSIASTAQGFAFNGASALLTGFALQMVSGNLLSGKVRVYGVRAT